MQACGFCNDKDSENENDDPGGSKATTKSSTTKPAMTAVAQGNENDETGGSKATAVRAAFAAQPDEPVPAGLVLAALS